jgi:hypothetical protein
MSTSLIIFLLCIIGVYSECRDLVPCERAVPYCHLPHLIKTMALNWYQYIIRTFIFYILVLRHADSALLLTMTIQKTTKEEIDLFHQ